jgi:rare lipoprotein A
MRMMMRKTTIGLSLVLLLASPAAVAQQTQSAHNQPAPSAKAKPASPVAKDSAKRHRAAAKPAVRSARRGASPTRSQVAALPPPDQYVNPVRVVGERQVGTAAWYGGRYVGRRTANGEILDTVRPTAAHRSLPFNTLVRVTNMKNGRSVIARINDRGPFTRSRVIDMSPKAAQELDMIRAGIIPVTIEQVAPASAPPRP